MVQANKDELQALLQPYGQERLLQFWDELSVDGRSQLARQISEIDFQLIHQLIHEDGAEEDWQTLASRAEPPTAFRLGNVSNEFSRTQARDIAEGLLAEGKLGVILVAGGQGTRLGFPHPKGMFPIGPVSKRTLFQMHVEQLRSGGAVWDADSVVLDDQSGDTR